MNITQNLLIGNILLLVKEIKVLRDEGERLTQRMAESLGENAMLEKKLNEIQFKYWESENKLTTTDKDLRDIHEKFETLRSQLTETEVDLEVVRYDLEKAVSNKEVMGQENVILRDEKQELMAKLEKEVKVVETEKKNKETLEKENTFDQQCSGESIEKRKRIQEIK